MLRDGSFRVKKSRSMLVSLYSLAFISICCYLALSFFTFIDILTQTSFESFGYVGSLFISTTSMIFVSLMVATPVAVVITFLVVNNYQSRISRNTSSLLRLIDQAPMILYGVIFLLLFTDQFWFFYLLIAMIAIPKLSYRWIKLSNVVTLMDVETVQSLGFNFWQVLKVLYLKRLYKMYFGHFLSVTCLLFGIVTPLLCFVPLKEQFFQSFSVLFFLELGRNSPRTSLMLLIILFIHMFRIWFDSKAIYHEVENG